jgi:hypothetical protein
VGYLRAWKANVAGLAAVAVLAALVAVALWVAHKRSVARAKAESSQRFVAFVVTGSAPAGVSVIRQEGGDRAVILTKRVSLPYRATVSTANGSPSYQFVARLLGGGRIRCTVSVGSVVDVKEAAGANGSCAPAVSWQARGSTFGGGGWIAG